MTLSHATSLPTTPFLGLAPFLRMNIAGTELRPIAQEMLLRADQEPDNANLWMNLSIALLALGEREIGLSIQSAALDMQRVYALPAAQQPGRFRLLMLMAPGDLAANTPLECLLENSDIDLCLYYLTPGDLFARPIPEHDALLVALSEDEAHREFLVALPQALADWPTPVINPAQNIPRTGRAAASDLLQNVPGLLMPPTRQISRSALFGVASGQTGLDSVIADCAFPIILRPLGSHAGRDLEKLNNREQIADYLTRVNSSEFFISPFIDYTSQDGLFRKFRVALIDGMPFACHMGVSSNWMIHYVNAGMYEDASKRDEEAAFMANFADFAARHATALAAVHLRTGLDYVCIDCAETAAGSLLIFEIDHAMVVHAMDPAAMFPYKQKHMEKVRLFFREFLFRLGKETGRQ